jgi:hypothetical protein
MPTVLKLAQSEKWAVTPLTKTSCTPGDWFVSAFAYAECTKWLGWAEQQVSRLHPDVAILAGDFADMAGNDQVLTSGIASLVQKLGAGAHNVLVLGDPVHQAQSPVDCLLASGATMATCSKTPSDAELAVASDESSGVTAAKGKFIDVSGWFCYDNTCPMVVGNTIVYSDSNHITATYATQLSQAFTAAFQQAVGQPATAPGKAKT